MASQFRGVIDFFTAIGIYDVVLPFLLVFAIVFAILEKTKVFGTEDIDGKKYTRKNINALVSFVISFLVVASSRLVEIITTVSSQMVILLMLSVLFLLLVGSFFKEEPGGVFLPEGWKIFFMFIMFIGISMIFLNALGWLDITWRYLSAGTGGAGIGAIIFLVVIVLFIVWIIKGESPPSSSKKSE
ncbi:MAG: hypothetical protein KJ601_01730 [Nanoarchaeota archaeon]|nr:hypothetical protein [Nanoarchaeota archaeon]MBU1705027.1 hypothetical protein [Nanoarchaeota archaeon]